MNGMTDTRLFKIFLLDDDPFCMAICHRRLQNMGYKDIACFTDEDSCLAALVQRPAVVFADSSPGSTQGIEVLKKIKQFNPDVYVIILSAYEETEMAANALKHGAFDYIIKGQEETEKIKKALQKIQLIQDMLNNNKTGFLKQHSYKN